MSNVSDWHRKQRKKELQKNKAARIASRDEKVKSEKTEQMVMEEIRKLEKQHKNTETRPHAIQSKIDRLKKELKIVKESAVPPTISQPTQPAFTPLARPELSVYYDPKLNPYGEPPPGKPRLFHRRGGGVTMHMEEAGLPGEVIPPPPPPPRREATSRPPVKHPFPEKKQQDRQQPPSQSSPESRKEIKQKTIIDLSGLPALPKPSAAVNRSKRKLQCDIWASNEEVEYEEAIGTGLEGVVTVADTWWYLDTSHQVQGPFPLHQMKQWIQAGFFPSTTKVRSSDDEPWKAIIKQSVFQTVLPEALQQQTARQLEGQRKSSVQDRIASLRQQSEEPDRVATDDSWGKSKEREEKGNNDEDVEEHDEDDDNSVQQRIAALRDESRQKATNSEASDDESDTSVQRRIAALRSAMRDDSNNEGKHDVPSPNTGESTAELQPMYLIDSYTEYRSNEDEIDESGPPPAYPLDDSITNGSYVFPHAYPIDALDETVPSYPLDVDYPATGEYPVTDAYPSAYPVDANMADEALGQPELPEAMERPKKQVKVDKELVAFMPSHLQKKRLAKAK
ncbi:hypothetical protein FisN_15Lh220 [Fistulifera solaris]|uniref:GYF domain-containing protein n=1 Tax=Fistulifera solaris TaxID=1519565 RepID=A0A1Z5JE78_FISSO|nr:hypothetical protein FisN_15Lh220 [Fistulifera solaris]|eukprot:GAX12088.1 hypothetical protein FisN_15Lh220 [Fistulifera solaris]